MFSEEVGLAETLGQDKSGFPFTAPGVITIHGPKIYAGFGTGLGCVNQAGVQQH